MNYQGTGGYIALFRCLLDKSIWKQSTPEQKSILITLLLMANHKENEWEWQGQKFKVLPGQMITSLNSIAERAGKGVSIQNVRTALTRFQKLGFLTYESTKTGRLINIVNWRLYQGELMKANNEPNKAEVKTQQRPNKDLTTNNNDNNVINNITMQKKSSPNYSEDFIAFWGTYPKKEGKSEAFKTWQKLLKEGFPPSQLIEAGKRYANQCERDQTERKFIKKGVNFLRHRAFEDYLHEPEPEEDPTKKTLARLYAQSAVYLGRDENVL